MSHIKFLRHLKKIPKSVWALGFVSLFMDVSSELIHSLLPIFLVSSMGASLTFVGLVEGVGESTALIVKIFSGSLSDLLQRRKIFVVTGYTLSALTKPLFPLAASLSMVFTARILDRIGKGIRDAPRDALISDLVSEDNRGASFGLRQTLDTIGAIVGPLLAIVLMIWFASNIRLVFWVAVIPATIAVVLVMFTIAESKDVKVAAKNPKITLYVKGIESIGYRYWILIAIGAFLTLARFSEAFLVLKTKAVGMPLNWIPIIMIIMNIAFVFSALPSGIISDISGRSRILIIGILLLGLSCLLLAQAADPFMTILGVILWGLHMGLTQGLLSAMVADVTPIALRGFGYGMFYFVCGITTLLSSVLAGIVGDQFGMNMIFYVGAGFSIMTLILLLVTYQIGNKHTA